MKIPRDHFAPPRDWPFRPETKVAETPAPSPRQAPYRYTQEAIIAVNVALASERAILLCGPSGVGKSAMASDIAKQLKRNFLTHTITSATRAQDLKWHFDAVRRLRDAQGGKTRALDEHSYTSPGVLWWAYNEDSARALAKKSVGGDRPGPDAPGKGYVVLLDEFDKGSIELWGDLLEPIGPAREFAFEVREGRLHLRVPIKGPYPLVVLTANSLAGVPRELLRRCVILRLEQPKADALVEIAELHFGATSTVRDLAERLVDVLGLHQDQIDRQGTLISTAEFIDLLRVCRELGIVPGDSEMRRWEMIRSLVGASFDGESED